MDASLENSSNHISAIENPGQGVCPSSLAFFEVGCAFLGGTGGLIDPTIDSSLYCRRCG